MRRWWPTYQLYEGDLHRMNAMDFDDLLFRAVNLFELFDDVRERYIETFATCSSTSTRTPTTPSTACQLLVGGDAGRPRAALRAGG
jgi:hypothetical protein